MSGEQRQGFATRAIHAGQDPDELTGAVNVPIYLTSTYQQQEIGKNKGHEYARLTNPTRDALEVSLCALEGGTSAHVFGSGMAAITALCTMMKSGDHVVCSDNVYGGTARMFDNVMAKFGLSFTYVDTSAAENVAAAITPATKLVHVETPTNPMMAVTDIRAVADICHARGVELSVDNTFLSPYLQQPIALGADIVMHSTTKFLNGHSDGLGGVLVCTTPESQKGVDLKFNKPSPMDWNDYSSRIKTYGVMKQSKLAVSGFVRRTIIYFCLISLVRLDGGLGASD